MHKVIIGIWYKPLIHAKMSRFAEIYRAKSKQTKGLAVLSYSWRTIDDRARRIVFDEKSNYGDHSKTGANSLLVSKIEWSPFSVPMILRPLL